MLMLFYVSTMCLEEIVYWRSCQTKSARRCYVIYLLQLGTLLASCHVNTSIKCICTLKKLSGALWVHSSPWPSVPPAPALPPPRPPLPPLHRWGTGRSGRPPDPEGPPAGPSRLGHLRTKWSTEQGVLRAEQEQSKHKAAGLLSDKVSGQEGNV